MDFNYFDPAERPDDESEVIETKNMFSRALDANKTEGVSMLDGNINDMIATLTLIARRGHLKEEQNKDMENEISILSYLRDRTGAKTGKEAFNNIANGKIDQKVVEFWIEEEMTGSANITKAIKAGYPELLKEK